MKRLLSLCFIFSISFFATVWAKNDICQIEPSTFHICLNLANQGDVDAQYKTGELYDKGLGVQQDYKEAAKWYTQAAQQGHAEAQFSIGYFYMEGLGVPQNYTTAVKWYQKAASQGLTHAQNNMAFLYKEGLGVKQDKQKAMEWYLRASEQGLSIAQNNIGFFISKRPWCATRLPKSNGMVS
ncbi:tetratricopeptide repeat protein [Xenorhabdus bovienii]|uniref:tetratricopeptide repeat protein n=1 Tax=Xenorhabdus bovienii TaxID=40576 RepID=UPI0004D98EEB|nr:tetratricopeptide repeat protein [Xenorhabdus bovienii]CDG86670.1 putative Beta-lactamase [Xenorhabdus bovienii str. feltiae France]CDG91434.1 putative Beta-lactamase [Xenorhabdus bovienii str. feltiae Florida]